MFIDLYTSLDFISALPSSRVNQPIALSANSNCPESFSNYF